MNRLLVNTRALLVLILTLITSIAFATKLQSILIKESPGKTSIFCSLTSIPTYREFILTSPLRAVVDFQQTNAPSQLTRVPIGHQLIKQIRMGHPTPQTLRLVFDLKNSSRIKIEQWKPSVNGHQGLRIDLISNAHNSGKITLPKARPAPHPYNPPQKSSKPIIVRNAPHGALRDVVIVIDAGHGGKDPGAIGPRRNAEKNVVLGIALRLKQFIDRQPGMHAVMTRKGDYYVGLRERLHITRQYNADMFVSIHADAFNNKLSNGASVFALSPRGATSEAARWLAEKENYSELGGVNLRGLDDRNGLIRTVLLDLSQTATINAGLQIGGSVLSYLNQMTTLHSHKVEQARFVVLKSPDVPSILVETGFITNPREEYNLSSAAYQNRLAAAIFNGAKKYFWEHPPHGTRVEAMLGGSNYLVHAEAHPRWQLFKSRGSTA
jgi:N-acetylmuramoyl-L-alanine amidase